jgi:hypothetical protein
MVVVKIAKWYRVKAFLDKDFYCKILTLVY